MDGSLSLRSGVTSILVIMFLFSVLCYPDVWRSDGAEVKDGDL